MNTTLISELLVCPACKGHLFQGKHSELICPACALAYGIRDGIPNMIPDEARTLSEEEKRAVRDKSAPREAPRFSH